MFNVGGPEIVVVLLVALIVLGPDQLPKAMRTVGNVMAEIRKLSNGFQAEMRSAMNSMESQSASSGPAASGSARPRDGAVTETVARNEVPTSSGASSAADGTDRHRPSIDPADRAAG